MTELKLDLLQTLSLAGVVYFIGIQVRNRISWLDRLNIPAAVVGGLLALAAGESLLKTISLTTSSRISKPTIR